jgi:hypothetical protein
MIWIELSGSKVFWTYLGNLRPKRHSKVVIDVYGTVVCSLRLCSARMLGLGLLPHDFSRYDI